MKIVGVTSCAMGIAHTFMAAEAIEKYFKKLGHEVKVERNGNSGPENELSSQEIHEADVIVFAISGDLYNPQRFDSYKDKIIQVSVQDALRKPEKIKEVMESKGIYK